MQRDWIRVLLLSMRKSLALGLLRSTGVGAMLIRRSRRGRSSEFSEIHFSLLQLLSFRSSNLRLSFSPRHNCKLATKAPGYLMSSLPPWRCPVHAALEGTIGYLEHPPRACTSWKRFPFSRIKCVYVLWCFKLCILCLTLINTTQGALEEMPCLRALQSG